MRQAFLQHLAPTSLEPLALEVTHAEGCWMYTPDGGRVLDLISGISVSNLGHGHPHIKAAVHRQVDAYMHLMVYGELVQAPQVQLAKALADTTGNRLTQTYFVSSGSEAIEGALKLAKRYTGRYEVVACHHAYHGATHGALSAGGGEDLKAGVLPLVPGFSHMRFGDEAALEHFITKRTAAVLIELIQGEAGVRQASPAYWKALQTRCKKVGALLIADEIQTGFGRTGTFWAHQNLGFEPDILVMAKGMGGGMPLGAFMATQEVMAVLASNPVLGHITTFGGHPVSCAASLAALQVTQEQNLPARALQIEQWLRVGLIHPRIKEIRGRGCLLAVEIGPFEELLPVIQTCLQNGVLTDWFLYCNTAMRIAPPLTISKEEIDFACGVIIAALNG